MITTERRIPLEDEQIIEHIASLMDDMFTLSEISETPTLDQKNDLIEPHREQIEETLKQLKAYKQELDNRASFAEKMRHDAYLRKSYEDMVQMIEDWDAVLK